MRATWAFILFVAALDVAFAWHHQAYFDQIEYNYLAIFLCLHCGAAGFIGLKCFSMFVAGSAVCYLNTLSAAVARRLTFGIGLVHAFLLALLVLGYMLA